MLLNQLITNQTTIFNPQISNIDLNSKNIKPGGLFFALKGKINDGAKFIPEAIKNGAVAVVCGVDSKVDLPENSKVVLIRANDVYENLILALTKFYSDLPANILAVTGTNGKTSTAEFIRQMQEMIGKKSASIGTVGIKISDQNIQNQLTRQLTRQLTEFSLTTPDIVSLYRNLAILKKNGVNDVAIEASSIGIEQKRLAGLKISLGAFTNFTQDHLDYHASMAKYFDAKMGLYQSVLAPNSVAILNADIPEFSQIRKIALENNHRIFTYGKSGSDVILLGSRADADSQIINFKISDREYKGKIAMLGEFQIMNILCALLAVFSYYGLNQEQLQIIISRLHEIIPAEGRMQKIALLPNKAQVFVDYAHSPDALKNVLENARKIPHNKLHVLFGCGGNRDVGKRPLMGKIASDLADFVIITDDNPRNGIPSEIRKEILQGCDKNKTVEIDNRKTAIEVAISRLDKDDILVIAGKGHEKYQIIGKEKLPFNEKQIILSLFEDKKS